MDALGGRPLVATKLENGMNVVACRSSAVPVVAVQIWVGVGSADETDAEAGLAHVHEHMLFKGTARRAVGEIAAEIERAGGEINAWTSYDQTVYHVVMARRFFETGLDVLADATQHSAFDGDELSRELEVILEEIKRSEDQPTSKVSRALFETAFKAHPYRRPVIGFREIVSKFTRDDVLTFFKAHYCADRMTAVVVGDVDTDVAIEKVRAAFAGASPRARALPPRPNETAQQGARAKGVTDDVEESHLAIGFPGPALLDDDMPAVDVLSVILGQGESSRLVTRVKREQQLVNETYAYSYTPKDPGLIVVGAGLHHEKLDAAMIALGEQIVRMREHRPRAAEMEKAKALLASEAIYQRETVEGMARRLGTWTLLTGDPSYESRYQERVAAVTADDVRRVAEKFLAPERATAIALAPKAHADLVDDARLAEKIDRALRPSKATGAAVGAAKAPKAASGASPATTGGSSVVKVTLPSGTRVVVERDTNNPLVTVRAAWLGGLRAEDTTTAGYSHLVTELINKGTSRHSAPVIAETCDAMAGHIDGFAGRNSIGMRATFLKAHVDRGLPLFFECMHDALFAGDELDRVRALVLEEMRVKADNPAGMAFDLFGRSLWLTHPYRRDLLGTAASVKGASSDALRAFWRAHATTAGAVLTFVGDIDPDEAIESVLDAMPVDAAAAATITCMPEGPVTEGRVARLTRARAQAHLVTGMRGLRLDDPDRFPLEVLSSSLSGQGGRLFLELRDKQSLCYSVSAFSVEGIEPGSFSVYMGTSPDKVDRALEGINALLADVAANGVTAAELDRSKRYLVGSHEIGLQRLGARGSAMVLNELYGLGHLAHRGYPEKIEAVTLDDVRRVAQRILSQPRVTTVVGPEGTQGPAATLDPPA